MLNQCDRFTSVLLKGVLSVVGIVAVTILIWAAYTIPHWTQFWDQAGGDISKVAEAINSFESSMSNNTEVMATAMPAMLEEMKLMREEIQRLKSEVTDIKSAANHLATSVPSQMDVMQNRIGQMNRSLTPAGMMSPMSWWP